MAKRVIWSRTARDDRRKILEYWEKRNGDKIYSKKLAAQFRKKVKYIVQYNYLGTETDMENVRVTVCGNYLLFYEIDEKCVKILAVWDNRRDPEDLTLY